MKKRLQYPVNITKTDARIAKIIATQYGGPDGEIRCLDALPLSAFHRSEPCLHGGSYRCSDRRARTSRNGIHDRSSADCQPHCGRNREPGICGLLCGSCSGNLAAVGGRIPFNSCEFQSKGIRSRICLRAWLRNRKHGAPTTISCGLCGIFRRLRIRSGSCGRESGTLPEIQ